MTEVEAIVEPGCLTDDIWRESVTFIDIHVPILPVSVSLLVSTIISGGNLLRLYVSVYQVRPVKLAVPSRDRTIIK